MQTSSVDDFVVSVNSHLTDRQKNERIKGIMARIEAYDVVVRSSIYAQTHTGLYIPFDRMKTQLFTVASL